MPDIYPDFASLASHARDGVDFRISLRRPASALAVVAPHGGGIEPGTSEIADAVASRRHAFYAFEGLLRSGNGALHVTSTRFDEPQCLALAASVDRVVTIHGEGSERPAAFVGGLDHELGERIAASLRASGFEVGMNLRLAGTEPLNLCNRGRSGSGVQLELSVGLRRTLFRSLKAHGRRFRTRQFGLLAVALRAALGQADEV